jgi:small subunit ribosomal protein S27e
MMAEPKSKFIKVRCMGCKNEQIIFGNSSNVIECLVCSKPLSQPTGGKSKISARVLEVLE